MDEKCPWEEIDKFRSPWEFEDFQHWIAEQVSLGNAVCVTVQNRYSDGMLRNEWWFQHQRSGEIWRLVEPDPPFYGIFEPIDKID